MSDFTKLQKGIIQLIAEARERRKPKIIQWLNKVTGKYKQK